MSITRAQFVTYAAMFGIYRDQSVPAFAAIARLDEDGSTLSERDLAIAAARGTPLVDSAHLTLMQDALRMADRVVDAGTILTDLSVPQAFAEEAFRVAGSDLKLTGGEFLSQLADFYEPLHGSVAWNAHILHIRVDGDAMDAADALFHRMDDAARAAAAHVPVSDSVLEFDMANPSVPFARSISDTTERAVAVVSYMRRRPDFFVDATSLQGLLEALTGDAHAADRDFVERRLRESYVTP